jgi:hypothetical protein
MAGVCASLFWAADRSMEVFGMVDRQALLERVKNALGLSCLAATLLLMSPGVTIVRADEAAKPSKQPAEPAAEVPAREMAPTPEAPRADDPAAQAQHRPIVLNTRGYNYGPNRPVASPMPAAPAPSAEKVE